MKQFQTDNLALAAYLEMKGLKYIKAELSLGKYDKPVVAFAFEDKLGLGKDLELEFMRSEIKRYRDIFFFFRGEIEKLKRQMDNVQLEQRREEELIKYNVKDIEKDT